MRLDGMPTLSGLAGATLFPKLPRLLRQALVAGQSARNRWNRYGAEYRRAADLLRESERWPPDQLSRHQRNLLRQLLRHAQQTTVHYAAAFAGFSTAELLAIAESTDLSPLPLLEKSVLKGRTHELTSTATGRSATFSTSGSTGAPLAVQYDRRSLQQRFACLHRVRAWAGIAPFDRTVRMSGRLIAPSGSDTSVPWLLNPFESMLLVSTYHLREPHLESIVRRVRAFAPALVDGYPTAIAQLARYCAATRHRLPSLRAVITTAETLTPDLRRSIEDGLEVPVFDYYSASEGVPFICQCDTGSYHVWIDSGVFEFLAADGRPAAPGETAEIVVTSFCQWKTPLIRYRTGDLAIVPADPAAPCPCGRTLPIVAGILGRIEDQVVTRDGRSIGMFPYRTTKLVAGIQESQIVQQATDRFLVRLLLDGARPLADVHAELTHAFAHAVGYPVTVQLEVVPAIERGPNGKFRSLIRTFTPEPGARHVTCSRS